LNIYIPKYHREYTKKVKFGNGNKQLYRELTRGGHQNWTKEEVGLKNTVFT